MIGVFQAGDEGQAHVARVGDSDALVLENGTWRSVFEVSESDELVETGATSVLPNHPDRIEYVTLPMNSFACMLVATDGVSRVIEAAPVDVGAPFAQTLATPCTELEYQALIGFERRGAHDDRTAVAVWPRRTGAIKS